MIIKENLETLFYLKEMIYNGTYDDKVMEVVFSDDKRNLLRVSNGEDERDYTPMITLYVEYQEKINGRWIKTNKKDILTCHHEFFAKNCGEGMYKKILRILTQEQ